MPSSWYKDAIVYQIYPRSFKDSNGDGIGDLRGVIEKLDYIQSLGVTAVWLNPIFKSPNDDGGYDISDYYSIQPEFGTMEDFDALLDGLHRRGLKLIMDLVLNHSSDEHPWFQESKKSKDNPYRDFYFWKKGTASTPPNNWPSFFGGSAWQYDENTKEYYLHLFSRKQPDLNWENKILREELKKIMRFWLDKGVDGLRLDVITAISKRVDFPDTDTNDFNETIRKFYTNGPRLKEFIKEIRHDVLNHYPVITVGEGPGITPENAIEYLDENDGLSMIFHFGHMFMDQGPGGRFDPKPWALSDFKKVFEVWNTTFAKRGWGSVFLGNHDFSRMVSRWGNDQEYRQESSKLFFTLMLCMPGTPFIFQGDEIGMTNISLKSVNDSKDIETLNGWREAKKRGESEEQFLKKANYAGRDNARTPMQWSDVPNAGFTSGNPWMSVNQNHTQISVRQQEHDPDAVLSFFKQIVQLRRKYTALREGSYQSIETSNNELFVFLREKLGEKILVALNFSSRAINFPFDTQQSEFLLGNYRSASPGIDQLRPWEAVVFKLKNSDKH
jgi:oligo-1,6-glucosidase